MEQSCDTYDNAFSAKKVTTGIYVIYIKSASHNAFYIKFSIRKKNPPSAASAILITRHQEKQLITIILPNIKKAIDHIHHGTRWFQSISPLPRG